MLLCTLLVAFAPASAPAQCEFVRLFDCDAPPYTGTGDTEDFGEVVALQGARWIVGNAGANSGVARDGCVMVYELAGSQLFLRAVLDSPGYHPEFGARVAVDGDTVVGADSFKSLEIFERDGDAWVWTTGFHAPNNFQQVGRSVAIDGDRIAVGTPISLLPESAGGVVVTFRRVGGVWTEEHTIHALMPVAGDAFGTSVDLVVGRLVVGAPGADASHGAAWAFDVDDLGWSEVARLAPSDRRIGDKSGSDVATNGDVVLIGAGGDDDQGTDYGSVTAFSVSGTTCATLEGFPKRVSLAAGGTISLQIRAGSENANRTYFVAGSLTDTSPGPLLRGFEVPLVPDEYFPYTLALAGLKLYHAYVVFEAGLAGPWRHVSNALSTRLDP